MSFFNFNLGHDNNCLETDTMKVNTVSEFFIQTFPVFESSIASFIPLSCKLLWYIHWHKTIIWEVNGARLTTITFVGLTPLSSHKKLLFQATNSKNGDIWITSSTKWTDSPDNLTSLDADCNFITKCWASKFMREPTSWFIFLAFDAEVCPINSDLAGMPFVRF
jgi:hypothetical protein